jgi:hypothetical protein
VPQMRGAGERESWTPWFVTLSLCARSSKMLMLRRTGAACAARWMIKVATACEEAPMLLLEQ